MEQDLAKAQARKLALVQAHYMGAERITFPRVITSRQPSDRAIWDEFNGRNIDALARKHGLSVPQTYAVVAEQRLLARRRAAAGIVL